MAEPEGDLANVACAWHQTLWDLANALARRLTCVDAALAAHVLQRPVIGLDQTSWPRLEIADSKPW